VETIYLFLLVVKYGMCCKKCAFLGFYLHLCRVIGTFRFIRCDAKSVEESDKAIPGDFFASFYEEYL